MASPEQLAALSTALTEIANGKPQYPDIGDSRMLFLNKAHHQALEDLGLTRNACPDNLVSVLSINSTYVCPALKPDDMGEYVCTAQALSKPCSVYANGEGRPVITIAQIISEKLTPHI